MSGRIWPGALCYITRSFAGNEGKVVECIKRVAFDPDIPNPFLEGPRWIIAQTLIDSCGFPIRSVAESALVPILPPPSADTTEDRSPCEVESV